MPSPKLRCAVLTVALCFAFCVSNWFTPAHAQSAPKKGVFVISHVSVVDVRAGRVVPDQSVLIRGERIVRVSAARVFKTPPGARVIRGKGLFLLPGLFDSHVHLNTPQREAPLLIANGVTFVRDMGGNASERFATRAQARRGAFYGLEMICVGTILDGKPPYHAWSRACGTPEEGRAAVREMKRAGADQIKVYSLLKPEVHRAICEEARKLNLKVVGHVPDALTLENAVAGGQSGVEHLSGYESLLRALLPDFKPTPGAFGGGVWEKYADVDKPALRAYLGKLAATGAAQCPTLVLHAGQARLFPADAKALWNLYALPDERSAWNAAPPAQYADYSRSLTTAFPLLQQTVAEMNRVGTPLLVGTDLGNGGVLAGFAVHQEMRYWQDAGMTSADILRAATITPARFFGVEARLGTVEAGKTASLVLTRKNPLLDVQNAAEIQGVWARGAYYDRAALDRLLALAREDVAARSPDAAPLPLVTPHGESVARGRYKLYYGPYEDGTEEFAITRDAVTGGYRFAGVRRQTGFGRYATVHRGEWGDDYEPQFVELRPSVLLPTVEDYRIARGELRGKTVRNAKTVTASVAPFPKQTALRSSLLAMDYFFLQRLELKEGETKRVEAYLLGRSDWKPENQPVSVTRKPDETVKLPTGQTFLCRRYALRSERDAATQTDIWVNAEGLPVKRESAEGDLKRSAVLDLPPLPPSSTASP